MLYRTRLGKILVHLWLRCQIAYARHLNDLLTATSDSFQSWICRPFWATKQFESTTVVAHAWHLCFIFWRPKKHGLQPWGVYLMVLIQNQTVAFFTLKMDTFYYGTCCLAKSKATAETTFARPSYAKSWTCWLKSSFSFVKDCAMNLFKKFSLFVSLDARLNVVLECGFWSLHFTW